MRHKILLLDELGERWGESHTFYNLRTPADAIRLLCINYPDFGKYLATSHEQGIAYQVTQVGNELKANELTLPLGQHDLVITPVIIGSEGAVKAIAGFALITTAVLTGGAGGIFATFTSGGIAGGVAAIGAGLVLSGVGEMLAPQPTTYDSSFDVGRTGFNGGPAALERGADGQQSYAYRGASNTVGIGKTIPIVYGKALVGSHLITTDIDVVNESDPLMTSFEQPSNSTVRLNGEKVLFSNKIQSYDNLRAARTGLIQANDYGKPNANIHDSREDLGRDQPFNWDLGETLGRDRIGFVNLEDNGEQEFIDNLQITSNSDTSALMVAVEFQGLHDRIGDDTSTMIAGYISFAIIIKTQGDDTTDDDDIPDDGGPERVIVFNQQYLVQGTQGAGQRIRYVLSTPVAVDSFVTEGITAYRMFVKILDKAIFNSSKIRKGAAPDAEKNATRMRMIAGGYRLIKKGDD